MAGARCHDNRESKEPWRRDSEADQTLTIFFKTDPQANISSVNFLLCRYDLIIVAIVLATKEGDA